MKSSQISSLLLAAASSALAQNYTQSKGFTLSLVDAANKTLNGYVISSCHAGAAIEALCIGPAPAPGSDQYSTYYLNTTEYNTIGDAATGVLVWNLPYTGENGPALESEPLSLLYTPGSNLATALFEPSEPNLMVGFDGDDKLFAVAPYDDSKFTAGTAPMVGSGIALYHWEACSSYIEGYYYSSLAWVTAGAPSNPTCSAVNVTRTYI